MAPSALYNFQLGRQRGVTDREKTHREIYQIEYMGSWMGWIIHSRPKRKVNGKGEEAKKVFHSRRQRPLDCSARGNDDHRVDRRGRGGFHGLCLGQRRHGSLFRLRGGSGITAIGLRVNAQADGLEVGEFRVASARNGVRRRRRRRGSGKAAKERRYKVLVDSADQ